MSLRVHTQGGGAGGAFASIFVTGLSEADTVTATKDGKTVRGKWVTKENPAWKGVLPVEYTELEYLESTGTQYIDTNWIPPANSGFDVKYSQSSVFGGDNNQLLGCMLFSNNSLSKRLYLTLSSLADTKVRFGVNSTQINLASSSSLNTEYEISYHGTVVDSFWGSFSTEKCSGSSYPMYVFAANVYRGANGAEQYSAVRIYKLRFYEGDTVVRDFIPAKRNSDNVLGLYDIVNNVFYTNAGTGEFIAGAEIPSAVDGHLISKIKDYGMWSVTATNGKKTTTQDVLVDAAVEYEIPMRYWNGELYEEGNEFEDITGGWVGSGKSPVSGWTYVAPTINDSDITLNPNNAATAPYIAFVQTAKTIDLTPYSYLKVLLDYACVKTDGMDAVTVGVSTSVPVWGGANETQVTQPSTTNLVMAVDISSINQGMYVYVNAIRQGKAVIKKIWLE